MSSTTKPLSAEEQAFEREKASITSYEQGWDRWDGPIWPVGTVQCRLQETMHSGPSTPSTPRMSSEVDMQLRHLNH